ncbi:MAG: hypothetical protein ACYDH9_13925 [Limisphaerales bacterium]
MQGPLVRTHRFRKVVWISGWRRQLIFGRATVLLSDRHGLVFPVTALPSGAPAANLLAAWCSQGLCFVMLLLFSNR